MTVHCSIVFWVLLQKLVALWNHLMVYWLTCRATLLQKVYTTCKNLSTKMQSKAIKTDIVFFFLLFKHPHPKKNWRMRMQKCSLFTLNTEDIRNELFPVQYLKHRAEIWPWARWFLRLSFSCHLQCQLLFDWRRESSLHRARMTYFQSIHVSCDCDWFPSVRGTACGQ